MNRNTELSIQKNPNDPKRTFLHRIEDWRFRGYRVSRLEALADKDDKTREEALRKFEKDLRELEEVRQVVEMMKGQGLTDYIQDIIPLLNDPDQLKTIAQKLIELDKVIESMSAPSIESEGVQLQHDTLMGDEEEEWEVEVEVEVEEPPGILDERSTPTHEKGIPATKIPDPHAVARATGTSHELRSILLHGKSAYSEGSYEDALILFDQVLSDDPNNIEARFFRTKTLKHLREQEEPSQFEVVPAHEPLNLHEAGAPEPRTPLGEGVRTLPEIETLEPVEQLAPLTARAATDIGSPQPLPEPPLSRDQHRRRLTPNEMDTWFQEYEIHKAELAELKRRKEQEFLKRKETNVIEDQIQYLKNQGFDVSRLEKTIEEGFKSLHSEFSTLTGQVQQLIDLNQRLENLAASGFRDDVEAIKANYFDIQHLPELYQAIETLESQSSDLEPSPAIRDAPPEPYTEPDLSTPDTAAKARVPSSEVIVEPDALHAYPSSYDIIGNDHDAIARLEEQNAEILQLRREIAELEEDLRDMEYSAPSLRPTPPSAPQPHQEPTSARPLTREYQENDSRPEVVSSYPSPVNVPYPSQSRSFDHRQPRSETIHPPLPPSRAPISRPRSPPSKQSIEFIPPPEYPGSAPDQFPRRQPQAKYCPRCRGSGTCTICDGSRDCAWCGGTGYGQRLNDEGRCYYCNGMRYCLWCNGNGRCESCNGTGLM